MAITHHGTLSALTMSVGSAQDVRSLDNPTSSNGRPLQQPNPLISSLKDASIPSRSLSAPPTTTTTSSSPTSTPRGANTFPLDPSISIIPYDPLKEPTYLPAIQSLISGDLSEPYSIYCYRYFLYQWPGLCFLALDNHGSHSRDSRSDEATSSAGKQDVVDKDEDDVDKPDIHKDRSTSRTPIIGAIVSKLEPHRSGPLRGYIGMLAVSSSHRSRGIATSLVATSIDAMIAQGADEIALETEVTNAASLKLYERLGFLRSKRLHRYYLNGSSAFRLVLYVREGTAGIRTVPDPVRGALGEDGEEEEEEGGMYS